MVLHFALLLRGWTHHLVVFTNGAFELPAETQDSLRGVGVRVETEPISHLQVRDAHLTGVVLNTASVVAAAAGTHAATVLNAELNAELRLP